MATHQPITLTKRLQALAVDIIRRLWDLGKYHNNKWLQQIHDTWFHHWVDVKTANTMADVDDQVDDLHELWDDAEEDPWVITEELEGETPLGGELRATHRAFRQD